MMAPGHRQLIRRRGYRALPPVVLALCLLVTMLVWGQSRRRDEAALRAEFSFMADKTVSAIENHLQDNIQVLRGVAGLFAAWGTLDRHEFRDYVGALRLEERYPGLREPIANEVAVVVDGTIYRNNWSVELPQNAKVFLMRRLAGG